MSQILVSTVSALTTGKKVTITLDTGWKYLALHLKRTGFTAAQATDYVLKINGKPVQSLDSLQVLEDINTHYNRPQVAGFTSIFFNRPELADSEDRDINGLGTADVRTVQIEFTLATGLVGLDMEVVAEVAANENLGFITHLETADVDLPAVGKNVISKMPVGNGNVFAYFMAKPTDDITDIVFIRVVDGVKNNIIESTKEFLVLGQKQAPMKPRVPVVADYAAVDFTLRGVPEDALQTDYLNIPGKGLKKVERVSAHITAGSAETLSVITESVGVFNG